MDLVVKVHGKFPLEGAQLEEAIVDALRKGKASFSQSDFLARRQEDYQEGRYPEYGWAPPEEEVKERRNFESSLEIFRRGPDVYYAPIPERKRRSHSHSKK